jgi:hypothetical protein
VREAVALERLGEPSVQEQVGDVLERRVRGDVVDGISGDREPSGLAVDVTESSRCGDDVVQSLGHGRRVAGARYTCQS